MPRARPQSFALPSLRRSVTPIAVSGVNCIAPGVTPTRAYYKFGDGYAKTLIDEQVVFQPIKRAIGTDEQAAGISWLCSDEAAMVTGHILPIDGGWTAL